MKKYIIIICLIALSTSAYSQVEMKEVSIEDLTQNVHPKDSTASAAILFDQGDLDFNYDSGWNYRLDVKTRIKIYNQDGYDQANIEIPYYKGNSNAESESISYLKAVIYNLVDGEIVETKVSKKDIFEEEINDVVNKIKFAFPKVEDGSIIEYSCRYTSPHVSTLPTWNFQQDIPVDYSVINYNFPDKFLNYKPIIRGFHHVYTSEEFASGKVDAINSETARSTKRASFETNFKKIVHHAENIPKISGESYVNNINNYLTSVKYELLAYRGFAQNAKRNILNVNWGDVTKAIYKSNNFGDQISKQNYFKSDIDKIILKSGSDYDKMNHIFEFVKSKMEWNKKNRLFTSDKIQKVYKEGRGNSADINIMLNAMLQYAKLDAKPVLSSTISNGIPFSPTISGLNYVTSLVRIDGQTYLLDATSKYSKPNLLPRRALNWNGIIITESGFTSEIDLMPTKVSKINTMLSADLSTEGEISGKIRRVYFDYFALNYRSNISKKSIEDQTETLENKYQNTKISNLSNSDVEDISKPVMQTFDFKSESNYVDIIGGKLYISPMLFLALDENPFKTKTRDYPIDFTYPRESKLMLTINIPEGYMPDYVPEQSVIALPNDKGMFKYFAAANENKIQLSVTTTIKANILPADFYQSLKEFFQTIVEKENEKIVLKKV
ncbi:DUF3857 domain-containing protein [Psychroflexus halocasei]|uniref:Uncharacterized protein n=1 Tax=Psychroflexus halocasei TaxID=908615 RepID=A0A1H3ZMP9_9FLAO|nr:DUF3857 domain-containing protein [Psychroflexus halocasei]SEA24928.1 protein of unknown function [Psychroflexus halocasei]